MDFFLDRFESPIGTLLLATDDEALWALDFLEYEERMRRLLRIQWGAAALRERRKTLGIWFNGNAHRLWGPARAQTLAA